MSKRSQKGGKSMTRKGVIQFLREQETRGNEQVISLIKMINLYLPRFLEYPEAANISEINRYNSLVRSNIYEKRLLDKLIIQR